MQRKVMEQVLKLQSFLISSFYSLRLPKPGYIIALSLEWLFYAFKSLALIATISVLKLINTAPTAGLNTIPIGAKTPAASGIAKMLYPAAHHRFWTIFR